MKTLVILALAALGAWYLINQAKQNKQVVQAQKTAIQYTTTLQRDASKAQAAAEAANKAVQKTADELQKALPKE